MSFSDGVVQLLGVILGASWLTALITWKIHRDKLPLDRDSATVASAEKLVAAADTLMNQLRERISYLEREMQQETERAKVVLARLSSLESEASQARSALAEIAQWRAIPADRWIPPTSPIPATLRQYVDEALIGEIEARGRRATPGPAGDVDTAGPGVPPLSSP